MRAIDSPEDGPNMKEKAVKKNTGKKIKMNKPSLGLTRLSDEWGRGHFKSLFGDGIDNLS